MSKPSEHKRSVASDETDSANAVASFNSFGELLRHLRRRAGMTQSELGRAVGYTETQITRLEHGQRRPDLTAVKGRFVTALGLQHEPKLAQRLIELAEATRHNDARSQQKRESSQHVPTNLPAPVSSFIGRRQELSGITRLISTSRLVALTGSGGVGKTRLALAVASALLAVSGFPGGVWFVELSTVTDPSALPRMVAAALMLAIRPGQNPVTSITEHLLATEALLILDNCEHLIADCASLTIVLLSQCPALHVLVTSREPLRVPGEVVYRVPSLSVPPADYADGDPTQYEAVQLFIHRARENWGSFESGPTNFTLLAEVSQRLDGIPLALELAAANLRVLSLRQVAERLADRFSLLTSGSRTTLPRHRTLRAAIDWSFALLTEDERYLLPRLSVFVGGFTLEAATAIFGLRDVFDAIAGLVDKSLVVAETDTLDGIARYRLLETIRQYALDKLDAAGERETTCDQHLRYFLELAEHNEPQPHLHVRARRSKDYFDRIQNDLANLRAALGWAIERNDVHSAVWLCIAMGPFWEARGYWSEGRDGLERVLGLVDDSDTASVPRSLIARAILQAAVLAWRQSDFRVAHKHFEDSLELFRETDDLMSAGSALNYLGGVAFEQGDYVAAQARYEQALEVWGALPDRPDLSCSLTRLAIASAIYNQGDLARARQLCEQRLPYHRQVGEKYSLSYALNLLGSISLSEGDYSAAQECYEESLALRRELGNKRSIAATVNELGYLHAKTGRIDAAWDCHQESARLYSELGNARGMASVLSGLAQVRILQGEHEVGAKLLSAVAATMTQLQSTLDEPIRSANEHALIHVRAQLPPQSFERALRCGSTMSLEYAIQYAQSAVRQTSKSNRTTPSIGGREASMIL